MGDDWHEVRQYDCSHIDVMRHLEDEWLVIIDDNSKWHCDEVRLSRHRLIDCVHLTMEAAHASVEESDSGERRVLIE